MFNQFDNILGFELEKVVRLFLQKCYISYCSNVQDDIQKGYIELNNVKKLIKNKFYQNKKKLKNLEKYIMVFKTIKLVFNIENKKKCFFRTKSAYSNYFITWLKKAKYIKTYMKIVTYIRTLKGLVHPKM